MDKFVARANIEHFRRKLTAETDETKRQTLARLLAEEEAKLASLMDDPQKKAVSRSLTPGSPMCGVHLNLSASFCVDPSVEHPPTGKDKRAARRDL
jgi:hypothetical protein